MYDHSILDLFIVIFLCLDISYTQLLSLNGIKYIDPLMCARETLEWSVLLFYSMKEIEIDHLPTSMADGGIDVRVRRSISHEHRTYKHTHSDTIQF